MTQLKTSYQHGNVTSKNRFFKSAMSEGLGTKDGLPDKRLETLYRTWANGGAGILVTGNVMIDKRYLGEPRNVILEDDRHLHAFKRWAQAGTENNTELWMQVNHPGKQVFKGVADEALAPSAILLDSPIEAFLARPREMSEAEIEDVIARFAETSFLAKQAGFTGVQIHGAHGYLISQFLSARHNKREDQWGGPIENRMRLLIRVYEAIREKVGADFPIGVKINSADFQRDSFSEEESLQVIRKLDEIGIDHVEISGGTYERPAMTGMKQSTKEREAYFLQFASLIRETMQVPLAVTGGFRSLSGMNQALGDGVTDFIGIARPLVVYPNLPHDLMYGGKESIELTRKKTGIPFVDDKAMLELTWYSQQLGYLAKGKQTKPDQSAYASLVKTIVKNGTEVFQKRRG
ncbi:NADH:flavin oxidoreductase/NADH oxidase family protein [Paenalkalicoccus suaedae]|uniref:NADH:flavin oxidoreductase/NADH oxidase family protein n=1 Tax=Paenalkalicoccus suaedae TaxID=2592382 RepID=A0A859FG47_9BACI|nr:NADH:flavin oxidoreductase/NADH oxidase family protein [Paenalkalicoccus suaedae]QKS71206.1 NADH:flavin oxidoreductase/NADH oxidase family protein [Paenalkalicoccus suaedae]